MHILRLVNISSWYHFKLVQLVGLYLVCRVQILIGGNVTANIRYYIGKWHFVFISSGMRSIALKLYLFDCFPFHLVSKFLLNQHILLLDKSALRLITPFPSECLAPISIIIRLVVIGDLSRNSDDSFKIEWRKEVEKNLFLFLRRDRWNSMPLNVHFNAPNMLWILLFSSRFFFRCWKESIKLNLQKTNIWMWKWSNEFV